MRRGGRYFSCGSLAGLVNTKEDGSWMEGFKMGGLGGFAKWTVKNG